MKKNTLITILFCSLLGCGAQQAPELVIPAKGYADRVLGRHTIASIPTREAEFISANHNNYERAQIHYVSDPMPEDLLPRDLAEPKLENNEASVNHRPEHNQIVADQIPQNFNNNFAANLKQEQSQALAPYEVYRSRQVFGQGVERDYNGPLSLGDPVLSSSLWQESRRNNNLYQDDRAWQPMDLVTIMITEQSEGKKEADTEVKQKTSILNTLSNLLGYEKDLQTSNPDLKLDNLINATSKNDYKGEADTSRKGSLKANISAMVVEVLPGNILRIEGEKIISVNSEEQVMVISGLVRPRDINSNNEIDSAKIAQLRIDFYGQGTVGDAQKGGWLGRIVRSFWPF